MENKDNKLTIWIEIFKIFSIFLIVIVSGIAGIFYKNTFINNKSELILLCIGCFFLIVVTLILTKSIYELIKYLKK